MKMMPINTFDNLKAILGKYESKLMVVHDKPDNYYLLTKPSQKNNEGKFFGAVQIKKFDIAFHLMPIYYHPDLLNDILDELKKHMQGKSCFNFNNSDPDLFIELSKLTETSYNKYKSLHKVN